MTDSNPDRVTGTLIINVLPQANGSSVCQLSSTFSDRPGATIECYGQTPDHEIAIALEQLAET